MKGGDMEDDIVLRTEDLAIGYHREDPLLKHLSLSLSKGSLTCLVGRNGAGKSTLLRTICGFLPPVAGKVYLNGRHLAEYSSKELSRSLSVVLTELLGEIRYLTVRQIVETGRYPYCDCFARLDENDRQITTRALQAVGMEHLAERSMAHISDGQRQKAMIAKALAQDTDLIALDEPLSFLDMATRIEIISLLQRLARENGKTMLLSTHDIDLALAFADGMWVMGSNGEVYMAQAPWKDRGALIDSVFGEESALIRDFLRF